MLSSPKTGAAKKKPVAVINRSKFKTIIISLFFLSDEDCFLETF